MIVFCIECDIVQPWKAQGGTPLRATACEKCGLPALRKLTPAQRRARDKAIWAALPPRPPVIIARQTKPAPAGRSQACKAFVCAVAADIAGRAADPHPFPASVVAERAMSVAEALAEELAKGGYLD